MDSSQLTAEQIERLADLAQQARLFYLGLARRMEARGFPPDDPLYKLAREAANRVNELWIDLHYRSCGVQRDFKYPPTDKPDE